MKNSNNSYLKCRKLDRITWAQINSLVLSPTWSNVTHSIMSANWSFKGIQEAHIWISWLVEPRCATLISSGVFCATSQTVLVVKLIFFERLWNVVVTDVMRVNVSTQTPSRVEAEDETLVSGKHGGCLLSVGTCKSAAVLLKQWNYSSAGREMLFFHRFFVKIMSE